jgi:uncharacterized alkaline shock family protein YloU
MRDLPPAVWIALAAVLLGVALLWLALRRQPSGIRAFANEAGSVTISRRAVQELIQQCCEELGAVGRAKAFVRISGELLHTRVELRLQRDAELKSISGYLQEQIGQALRQTLSLEQIGDIDVTVVGFLSEKTEKKRRGDAEASLDKTAGL